MLKTARGFINGISKEMFLASRKTVTASGELDNKSSSAIADWRHSRRIAAGAGATTTTSMRQMLNLTVAGSWAALTGKVDTVGICSDIFASIDV